MQDFLKKITKNEKGLVLWHEEDYNYMMPNLISVPLLCFFMLIEFSIIRSHILGINKYEN